MSNNKKYKIGYIAGVFDLFHIGHLNILKRSKEICEYLIVGVNTDDFVEEYKGKKPIIPYNERAEIVKSVKYVDEVFPNNSNNEWLVWNKYKYEVKTSGDDWIGNESLNKFQKEIDEKGLNIDLVYFPYTKSTSSTLLTKALNTIVKNSKNSFKLHEKKDLLLKLKNSKKNIVIFGAGRDSVDVVNFLQSNSINIDYVIDNSVNKNGKNFRSVNRKISGKASNIKIKYPKELLSDYNNSDDYIILITALEHYIDMVNQVKELGFNNIIFPYKYLWGGYQYSNEKVEIIDIVSEMLEDDVSKCAFNHYVKGVQTVDVKEFRIAKSYSSSKSYVTPDFFKFTENEVFVDCGAYTGDTIEKFIAYVGKYKKIFGFEPNIDTYKKLQAKYKDFKNIKLFNLGVSNLKQEAYLDTYGELDAGSNLIHLDKSPPPIRYR